MRALGSALLCLLVLAGCGDAFPDAGPKNPTHVADGLVFTRTDGSSYVLKDAVATCAVSQVTGTQYVYLTASAGGADFVLEVVSGVTGVRQLPLEDRLPVKAVTNRQGPADLSLLASDPRTGSRFLARSSRASGLVSVTEANCDPEPRVSFQIDATLRAPDGKPVRVKGGLATVT